MSTFAENPLFFFMDSMPSIIPVKTAKDLRQIVELSDTGCDARLPVSKISHNTNRYGTQKLSKMKSNEDWKFHCEENTTNKSHNERIRVRPEYDKRDSGKFYYIPRNEETNQQYWTRQSEYENIINGAQVRRRSNESKEIGSKLRSPTIERTRTRHWEDDNSYKISTPFHYERVRTPQIIPSDTNYLPKDHQDRSFPRGTTINDREVNYSRYNYPNFDQGVNNESRFSNRERMKSMERNHPEYFETREIPQNSPRYYKNRWQKSNVPTFNDIENFDNDEPVQKDHRYSRYDSKNTRNVNSAKSYGVSRNYEETIASRIRSRTCSPPSDRSKGPRTPLKGYYEKVHQLEDRYNTVILAENDSRCTLENSRSSREKTARCKDSMKRIELVDRAVDKDSLPDVTNTRTSIDRISGPSIVTNKSTNLNEGSNLRSTFWEFIPLYEEDGEQKCKKTSKNEQTAQRYQQHVPLAKRTLNDCNSNLRTKRRPVGKPVGDQKSISQDFVNLKSHDNETPLINIRETEQTVNDKRNLPSKTIAEERLNSNKGNRVASANINENRKVSSRLQSQAESKSQTRIASNYYFGWVNRSNRSSNSASEVERSDDKKKIENNRDALHVTSKKKAKTVVGKAEDCLKRKFDKSKIEEGSSASSNLSDVKKEKEIRSEESNVSKLPIRVGIRCKSRKPNAQRFKLNLKSSVLQREITGTEVKELTTDSCGEVSSARSRTKPRIKPSVIHNRVVIDSSETSGDYNTTVNAQPVADARNYFQDNTKEKTKLIEKQVKESTANRGNVDSSKLTFLRNEKLNVNVENGRLDDSMLLNKKEDQRKRNTANGKLERETSRMSGVTKDMITGIWRNDLKEKCIFHLNQEDNIVCNNRCSKNSKTPNYIRVTKATAVRSQF